MIRKLFSWWPDGPLAAGVLLTIASVLAFAPDLFLTMLARAFLWEWALVFLIVALWNLRYSRWWSAVAASIGCALTISPPLSSVTNDPSGPERTSGAMALRVAQMNLLQPNTDHAEVLATALRTDADVISFQEVSPSWARALEAGLAGKYPFHRVLPGTNCYGIALYSRLPFDRAEVVFLRCRPMIDATVRTASGPVRVLCVHATSPGDHACFRERNNQLEQFASIIAANHMPTLLIGDLNTVSWDHALRKLRNSAGLRENVRGVGPTWPSLPGFALMPLDHVLVTDRLVVTALDSFTISGSDHRGLVADIHLRS